MANHAPLEWGRYGSNLELDIRKRKDFRRQDSRVRSNGKLHTVGPTAGQQDGCRQLGPGRTGECPEEDSRTDRDYA